MNKKYCRECGRFPGEGRMCKEDAQKRVAVFLHSTICINSV